jgi:hypothetical protein
MSDFSYDNYAYFISFKPKFYNIIALTILLLISLIIYSFTIKTNDVYNISSYYECNDTCKIVIESPLDKVNDLSKTKKIKINKKIIDINDFKIGDVSTNEINQSNYQLISYDIEKQDILENTYQDVKIYFNEEIIFNKIVNYFIK